MNWKRTTIYDFVCWCKDFKNIENILIEVSIEDKKVDKYIEEFIECILEDEYGDWEETYKKHNITANDIYKFLNQTFLEGE